VKSASTPPAAPGGHLRYAQLPEEVAQANLLQEIGLVE
jgi:hypothetical protein